MSSRSAWIAAWHDPLASLTVASPECLALGPFGPDGSSQLCVACDDAKLRVVKGTHVHDTRKLAGDPVAVCAVRPMGTASTVSCIAVACGASVFVYRNLRPFFKFSVPVIPLDSEETTLWESLESKSSTPDEAATKALKLRDEGIELSSAGKGLAAACDSGDRTKVAQIVEEQLAQRLPKRTDTVTAMCSVAVEAAAAGTIERSSLAIGTEHGRLLLMARDGLRVDTMLRMGAAPFRVRSWGAQSGELRLAVLCRDGAVRLVKNGRVTATVRPSLPASHVALSRSAVVTVSVEPSGAAIEGPMAQQDALSGLVEAFNPRNGVKLWSAPLSSAPVAAASLGDEHKGAVAVALASGDLVVVRDGAIVSESTVSTPDDPAAGLAFGRYAKEVGTLIAVLRSGALAVRVLRRSAVLEPVPGSGSGAPTGDAPPLALPKRTRLHLTHVRREQETAADVYRTFARDMRTLSLRVRRAYVRVIASGADTTAAAGRSRAEHRPHARLDAEVQGVGPLFRVLVRVSLGAREAAPLHGAVLETVDETGDYGVEAPLVPVPTVAPGATVSFPVGVRWTAELPSQGRLRLTLTGPADESPLLVARAILPPSEPGDL